MPSFTGIHPLRKR